MSGASAEHRGQCAVSLRCPRAGRERAIRGGTERRWERHGGPAGLSAGLAAAAAGLGLRTNLPAAGAARLRAVLLELRPARMAVGLAARWVPVEVKLPGWGGRLERAWAPCVMLCVE